MKSDDIIKFIDNTIIAKLKENNIFEKFMSLEEIRHKLIYTVYNVEFEDLTSKECLGFWKPSTQKLVIEKKLENPSTQKNEALSVKIHELLHALTTKYISNVEERWGIQQITNAHWYIDENGQRVDIPFEEKGRGLNEGITEYFSQKLCPESEYLYSEKGISFNISGSYPLEQIMIKQLAVLYGEDKIIDAYINNKDIDIPEEAYKQLRRSFDHIDEKDSHIRNKKQGRPWQELSPGERIEIMAVKENIADTFKETQQFFLENCILKEINNINTKEQALEFATKLRELNLLNIKIEGNEKANYEKYNLAFARKYLLIMNKNITYDEQVKFEDILAYLTSGSEQSLKISETLENTKSFLSKVKNFVLSFNSKAEAKFTAINRGSEGNIYIREIGKEIISGNNISIYQYLTEEDYKKYQAGDKTIKGEILRGNIELKKLKKDKDYAKAVGMDLLSQSRVEDKLLNSNGYIGYIAFDYKPYLIPGAAKAFEESQKYIGVELEGFEQKMYICEIASDDKKNNIKKYMVLPKEEIEKSRLMGNKYHPSIIIQGNIDLERVQQDKKYRDFLEQKFLPKERVKVARLIYDGYVGEIIDIGDVYKTYTNPRHLEALALFGANGEEKIEEEVEIVVKGEKSKETIRYYLKKGEKTGEKDSFGSDIYSYEFIPSIEMQKMWADKNYANSPERERIIIKGSENEIQWHLKYERIKESVVYRGGYIGTNQDVLNHNSQKHVKIAESGVVLWEMNGNLYLSQINKSEFESRRKIHGNLDIEKINNDPTYRKFVTENILTQSNIDNIILTGRYDNIEFDEIKGEFNVNKKLKKARRSGHDLVL